MSSIILESNKICPLNIVDQKITKKVCCQGCVNVSNCALEKGLSATGTIIVENNSQIGTVKSLQQGLRGFDSQFGNIITKKNVKLTRCMAQEVYISSGSLKGIECQFKKIKAQNVVLKNSLVKIIRVPTGGCKLKESAVERLDVQDMIDLNNSSVKKTLKGMGSLKWKNDSFLQENFICKQILARDEVVLTNVKGLFVKSAMGAILAENCELEDIEARDGASLTNTKSDTVKVKMGPLNVVIEDPSAQDICYKCLEARDEVELKKVRAKRVKCSEGKVIGKRCFLDYVDAFQELVIKKSVVEKSVTLNVDPKKKCRLVFKDTIVNGDIIINTSQKKCSKFANLNSMIPEKEDERSDVVVNEGGCYQSIEDIPENVKKIALKLAKEGQTLSIGNLKCIVSRKKLKIRASLMEKDDSADALEKEKVLPYVNLEIFGGSIGGKIIFKNCRGNFSLLEGAIRS